MKSRIGNMVVYFIPVVILLIGIIAYFIIIPNILGKKATIEDWMLADPEAVLDILLEGEEAGAESNNTDKRIQLFWRIWVTGFIASLFFFCRKLQKKENPNNEDAVYIKREPYFLAQSVGDRLKQISKMEVSHELDHLIYEVKILEEKLSVESDFGYGDIDVIKCENEIAEMLQFLEKNVASTGGEDLGENVRVWRDVVRRISILLRRRTGMKRK